MLSQASHTSKPESITVLSNENETNTANTTANTSSNTSVLTQSSAELALLHKNKLWKTKRLVTECCERNFKFNPRFVGISAVLADNPDNVTMTDLEALRVECLAKLRDIDLSETSSDSSDNSPPGQLRKPKHRCHRSRHLVDPHSVMYDAKNPYTLSMVMKQPFMGNPYAHKMRPHYHMDSSPTSPVMGIMGHTIYQHHGTVGSPPPHRGFAQYSGSEFPTRDYNYGKAPTYGTLVHTSSQGQYKSVKQQSPSPNLSSAPSTPRMAGKETEGDTMITSTPKEEDETSELMFSEISEVI